MSFLTLPSPLANYDRENEAQTRRELMRWSDSALNGIVPSPGVLGITLVTADNTTVDTSKFNYAAVKNLTGAALHLLFEPVPADGDELTVKDVQGNCTNALPIIVEGNGYPIDFDTVFYLVFPGQSATFRFSATVGRWLASP